MEGGSTWSLLICIHAVNSNNKRKNCVVSFCFWLFFWGWWCQRNPLGGVVRQTVALLMGISDAATGSDANETVGWGKSEERKRERRKAMKRERERERDKWRRDTWRQVEGPLGTEGAGEMGPRFFRLLLSSYSSRFVLFSPFRPMGGRGVQWPRAVGGSKAVGGSRGWW